MGLEFKSKEPKHSIKIQLKGKSDLIAPYRISHSSLELLDIATNSSPRKPGELGALFHRPAIFPGRLYSLLALLDMSHRSMHLRRSVGQTPRRRRLDYPPFLDASYCLFGDPPPASDLTGSGFSVSS